MGQSSGRDKGQGRSGQLAAALAVAAFLGVFCDGGAAGAAEPAKKTSSCVACHTDVAKLNAEAAQVPVPAGSALQAGKG